MIDFTNLIRLLNQTEEFTEELDKAQTMLSKHKEVQVKTASELPHRKQWGFPTHRNLLAYSNPID